MKEKEFDQKRLIRTQMLLGEEGIMRLARARVAVFGIGGVGGYAAEALARSGIGAIDLVDHDTVSISNLNRQLIATVQNIGEYKVEAMRRRIESFAPGCKIQALKCFFLPETAAKFDFAQYDYVIDAVDTVAAKIEIILRAQAAGTPVISSMGTGNKLNPACLEVADVYETSVCPLARVMRRELKARGVRCQKVVYSKEQPRKPLPLAEQEGRRSIPGSTAFVPAAAGLILAAEVVRELSGVSAGETCL